MITFARICNRPRNTRLPAAHASSTHPRRAHAVLVLAALCLAPLMAWAQDTDNDGLLDTVETNTGSFVDASDTGTNPLLLDSDGEQVGDGDEVAEGTDPNAPADFPAGWVVAAHKISETTGSFTGDLQGSQAGGGDGAFFGSSLARLPDLDGDGTPELAVGAIFARSAGNNFNSGALWIVRLNPDGLVKAQTRISAGEGGFAGSLGNLSIFGLEPTPLGDIDGGEEIAVFVPPLDSELPHHGHVAILSLAPKQRGVAPAVLGATFIETPADEGFRTDPITGNVGSDAFGAGLTSLGDFDGDGIGDLVIGSSFDSDTAAAEGSLRATLLDGDTLVKAFVEAPLSSLPGAITSTSSSQGFGEEIEPLGDIDRDGTPDLLVGSFLPNAGVWLLLLNPDGSVKQSRAIGDGA